MLSLAALLLAAASPNITPELASTSPWWERFTYTIGADSTQQSCKYESSISGARACDAEYASSPVRVPASGSAGVYTKITLERRFTPAAQPDPVHLESGDTLLGRQIMGLTIDQTGAVRSCQIMLTTGELRPAYGCDEARAEKFEASVARDAPDVRQAFMTILVYGHEEYLA